MKKQILTYSILTLMIFSYEKSFGAGRDVIMRTFTTSNEKTSSEPVLPQQKVKVKLRLKCAGANLRSIANPLARDGLLIPKIILTTPNKVRRVFSLDPAASGGRKVPGYLANSSTLLADQVNQTGYVFKCKSKEDGNCQSGSATAYRSVKSRYGYLTATLPVDGNDLGDIFFNPDNNIKLPKVKVSFEQHLTTPRTWSEYRGHAGALTFYRSAAKWDANGREAKITVTFFGEEGYCGGYHSPLLLYFDQDRAQYSGVATFDLFGANGMVYWPEKGSKAFFLAIDRNKNNKIDSQNELFGNVVGEYTNGFQALAELDSNSDGVIDEKDAQFKDLILWNDSTGKGKTLKKDLYSLASKGVKSISLKYSEFIRPYGGRAEERAEATFAFDPDPKSKDPNHTLKEGKIIDVWFRRPTVLTSR